MPRILIDVNPLEEARFRCLCVAQCRGPVAKEGRLRPAQLCTEPNPNYTKFPGLVETSIQAGLPRSGRNGKLTRTYGPLARVARWPLRVRALLKQGAYHSYGVSGGICRFCWPGPGAGPHRSRRGHFSFAVREDIYA